MPMIDSQGSDTAPLLLLGGTAEANALARALAGAGLPAIYSYAGRTVRPATQPVPVRVGGFGGAAGLARWIAAHRIGAVIDATHPFAARISANAVTACTEAGVPLAALERPPWRPGPSDDWQQVASASAAAAALPARPARVFLAIGRQDLAPFAARPEHAYLLRVVDAPDTPLLPGAEVVVARGPFTEAGDHALMARFGAGIVVAKNAGGAGARAKLDAARMLGLRVIMIARPPVPARRVLHSVGEALRWARHARLGV